jgi:hypothetical protein
MDECFGTVHITRKYESSPFSPLPRICDVIHRLGFIEQGFLTAALSSARESKEIRHHRLEWSNEDPFKLISAYNFPISHAENS